MHGFTLFHNLSNFIAKSIDQSYNISIHPKGSRNSIFGPKIPILWRGGNWRNWGYSLPPFEEVFLQKTFGGWWGYHTLFETLPLAMLLQQDYLYLIDFRQFYLLQKLAFKYFLKFIYECFCHWGLIKQLYQITIWELKWKVSLIDHKIKEYISKKSK